MDFPDHLLGLHSEILTPGQMVARVIIVFITALIFIRLAGIRTLGKQSAFDSITLVMLGAMLGRSVIVGHSFLGTLLATFMLMVLHRFTALLTFKSKKAGDIIKGKNVLLMKNGIKQEQNLNKTNITEEDMQEALRRDAHTSSFEKIKEMHLERSGDISIVNE